jgi:hypothetical protein
MIEGGEGIYNPDGLAHIAEEGLGGPMQLNLAHPRSRLAQQRL